MSDQPSLGFVETAGLATAIIVADAMAKAAEVTILTAHKVDGQNVCVVCAGDVASCKAAVDVGVALASERGRLLASNVIPRPADGDMTVQELLRGIVAKKAARKAEKLARRKGTAPTACCCAAPENPAEAPATPVETAPKPAPEQPKNNGDNSGKKHKK